MSTTENTTNNAANTNQEDSQVARMANEAANVAKDTINQTIQEVKSFGKETNFSGNDIPRTKEGIRVSLIAAFAFICGYFGGYTPLLLLLGYAILIAKDEYITSATVKSLMLSILFSIFYKILNLPNDTLSVISNLLSTVGIDVYFSSIRSLLSIISTVIGWLEFLIFLMLSLNALRYKKIQVPFVEDLYKKYF